MFKGKLEVVKRQKTSQVCNKTNLISNKRVEKRDELSTSYPQFIVVYPHSVASYPQFGLSYPHFTVSYPHFLYFFNVSRETFLIK